MKIVLISSFWEPKTGGGTAVVVRELAFGLQSLGYSVAVITTNRTKKTSINNENGLTVYRIFPRNLYWLGDKYKQPIIKKIVWHLIDAWNPHAHRLVRNILGKENPDIVHVHKLQGMSPSIWAAVRRAGVKKLIHTSHDYELFIPEGALYTKIDEWAKKRPLLVRLLQSIGTSTSKKVNVFTSPSQYVLDLHVKRGLFSKACVKVVPNSHGFTNKEIQRRQKHSKKAFKSNRGTVRFLYIGRFDRSKGVDLLCEAFQKCTKTFSNINLDLLGNGGIYSDLQKKYGRNPLIQFHGYKTDEEKERFLFNCDVVVIPSVWQEPFGIVITESFCHSKPVIASRVGGIPEIVKDGVNGLLIPVGDIEALQKAITQVSQSPEQFRQMANACLESSKSFSLDAMLENYDLLYKIP